MPWLECENPLCRNRVFDPNPKEWVCPKCKTISTYPPRPLWKSPYMAFKK